MTLKERCQAGEAKLKQISNALLDPRPEILDHCEAELQEVLGMLSESVDSPAGSVSCDRPAASDKNDLLRLRNRIRLLGLQVQSSLNLFQGWAQLGLSRGYTEQGKPEQAPSEPLASYEV